MHETQNFKEEHMKKMSIEKKSLISTLKTTKKANVAKDFTTPSAGLSAGPRPGKLVGPRPGITVGPRPGKPVGPRPAVKS